MSISYVNEDPRGDCPVFRSEVGEFFSVGMGMKEKIPPKEVWGWYFILRPAESPSPKTIKIEFCKPTQVFSFSSVANWAIK
jgi:hypothetical protein